MQLPACHNLECVTKDSDIPCTINNQLLSHPSLPPWPSSKTTWCLSWSPSAANEAGTSPMCHLSTPPAGERSPAPMSSRAAKSSTVQMPPPAGSRPQSLTLAAPVRPLRTSLETAVTQTCRNRWRWILTRDSRPRRVWSLTRRLPWLYRNRRLPSTGKGSLECHVVNGVICGGGGGCQYFCIWFSWRVCSEHCVMSIVLYSENDFKCVV